MTYAVGLYLDQSSSEKLNYITRHIAQSGANSYMLEHKIPPHITLACVCSAQPQPLIDLLDENIADFRAGDVFWASLGVFVPAAVFAAPVVNEYLLDGNDRVHRLLAPVSTPGENGYYLPFQWVPHTALAVKLTCDELRPALAAAADAFAAFGGRAERLFLAQCEPYMELKTWALA